MQTSVPDLMDLSKEPDSTFEMYGPESSQAGHLRGELPACARRLAERDVRFIQLYHRGWDQHNDLPRDLALQCAWNRSADRCAYRGPEAARSARRHASGLGRRIRSHRI